MLIAYLLACIPIAVGATQWVLSRNVVWQEWVVGSALGLLTAGAFHLIVLNAMTGDVETWSGRATHAIHHPFWHARWTEEEAYTERVGSGENARTVTKYRTVTKTRSYPEHWTIEVNFGGTQKSYHIPKSEFDQVCARFGASKLRAVHGFRPNYDYGDLNDYYADNKKNALIPAVVSFSWTNKVRAAPSGFSFAKVPEDAQVFEYPTVSDWRVSRRRLGDAVNHFSAYEWDCMNSRLGPSHKVNVIVIGFGPDSDSSMAHTQEAAWIGGKKNDLVLCYGGQRGSDGKPGWSYVFGWTEQEIVKRNLETSLLLNPPSNALIPKIEAEIAANYVIKDWSKFDYLTCEPPWWSYLVLMLVMGVSQGWFWYYAHVNESIKYNIR